MSKSDLLRLFVALYPPPNHARLLTAAAAGWAGPTDRVVPAEHLHMTLVFLGPSPRRAVRTIIESLECACLEQVALRPRALVRLPRDGPPRVLALETDLPPSLAEGQRRLAQRLARPSAKGRREAFLPHLTLIRYDQQQPARAGPAPGVPAAILDRPIVPEHASLMQSLLTPHGVRHEEIARVALRAPRAGPVTAPSEPAARECGEAGHGATAQNGLA